MKSLIVHYKRFSPFFKHLSRWEYPLNHDKMCRAGREEEEGDQCTICQETLGQKRTDGKKEETYILPCGHMFGSVCITMWLQSSSLNHDCPICRRTMLYRGCGHAILPLLVPTSSKTTIRSETYQSTAIPEKEMPEKCPVCRIDRFDEEIRWLQKRREVEENAIRGLRVLPGFLGGMNCRLTAMDIERRVQENNRMWIGEIDGWVESRRKEVGWIW